MRGHQVLPDRYQTVSRAHVFVEAQLAAGAQRASHLGEGGGLIWDGAEHQRGDDGVAGRVVQWQRVRGAVAHLDRDGATGGGVEGMATQCRFRFDGEYAGHGGLVVGEVQSLPGADLAHHPGEPVQEGAAVLAHAALLGFRANAQVGLRELRVRVRLLRGRQRKRGRYIPSRTAWTAPSPTGTAGFTIPQ